MTERFVVLCSCINFHIPIYEVVVLELYIILLNIEFCLILIFLK